MNDRAISPAYRIETERMVIRCYNPSDAHLLAKSVQESKEHLLPWMPWAGAEPEDLQKKIDRLRGMRANFDLGKEFVFGIFNKSETKLIGGSGLHRRVGDNALEIGYWIDVNYINQGYATEMSKALTKVAFEIEKVKRVEIHCDPKNLASAAIPKKLGFVHEATLRHRNVTFAGESRGTMVWSMLSKEYQISTIPQFNIAVVDAIGRKFEI